MLLLSGESRNTQMQLKLKFRKTPKSDGHSKTFLLDTFKEIGKLTALKSSCLARTQGQNEHKRSRRTPQLMLNYTALV